MGRGVLWRVRYPTVDSDQATRVTITPFVTAIGCFRCCWLTQFLCAGKALLEASWRDVCKSVIEAEASASESRLTSYTYGDVAKVDHDTTELTSAALRPPAVRPQRRPWPFPFTCTRAHDTYMPA